MDIPNIAAIQQRLHWLVYTREQDDARHQVLSLMGALTIGKLVVILAAFLFNHSPGFLYHLSTRWDSSIFQSIAVNGYAELYYYAFSPLYPLLIKCLDFIVSHAWISSLVITNLASYLFPLVVYRAFGYRTALLAALFPTYLVFTTVPYSDIISLCLLALSILLVLQERFYELSAAVSMAILGAYRLACILPAFVFAAIKTRRFRNLVVFGLFPVLVGAAIFWWFKTGTGSFFTYFAVEQDTWSAGFASPAVQAKWLLHGWLTAQDFQIAGISLAPVYWLVRNILFEVFYLVGTFYLLRTGHKHKVFLFIYTMLSIIPLLCVTGVPAVSIPRLLLPAFPVFYSYSIMIKKESHLRLYITVCLALTAVTALIHLYSFFG